ncbi:sporulation protein [Clostridia bacterium]|nr:sporulation protein [Clostridia bacterium]
MDTSFSAETKRELAHQLPEKACCKFAEAAGLIRACGALKPAGRGEIGILLTTGLTAAARHIKRLFFELTGTQPVVSLAENGAQRMLRRFEVTVSASGRTTALLERIGILVRTDDGLLTLTVGISPLLAGSQCCRKAMLRGLFLGAGTMSDPVRGYHLEIRTSDKALAADIRRLMNAFSDIHAGISPRGADYVVYLKAADQVRDMLGIMGASLHLLNFEDKRMMHELRGKTNRLFNCDTANMDRAITAGESQLRAISTIEAGPGLDSLPAKLREAAKARRANPEASLSEIGAIFEPPISKSSAAARFARIEKIAKEIL